MAGLVLFAAASSALAQASKGSAVLPGGDAKQPINIESDKLDYLDKEQKLIYSGNVLANQGDAKMRCKILVIFLPPKKTGESTTPSSSSEVRRMEATGPVTMVSKDQIGTGDNGLYEKAENHVILTGNVTLSQGPNVTKGDKLVYDLKTGQARVTGGRVRSMFIPSNANDAQPK